MQLHNAERTHNNVDKVTRYGWSMQNKPGKLMHLPKGVLKMDPSYQRVFTSQKVLEIARDWSWISFGALTVADREGVYFVCDGWHRVNAALRRSDVDTLPCIVFKTTDAKEEAKAFVDVNSCRQPVSALAKHNANVVAGDETATFLQDLTDSIGLEFSKRTSKPSHIKAVHWCSNIASDRANRPDLKLVLGVAADLCKEAGTPIMDRLLQGLWYLNRNCEGGLSNKRLLKRIHEVGAKRLLESANRASAYYAAGGAKVWATGMLEEVNKKLHNRFSFKQSAED